MDTLQISFVNPRLIPQDLRLERAAKTAIYNFVASIQSLLGGPLDDFRFG
jgi:hypothetical protein